MDYKLWGSLCPVGDKVLKWALLNSVYYTTYVLSTWRWKERDTPVWSCVVVSMFSYWGSTHGNLNPDPMWIRDPFPKTTLPPHGLDLDPSCVLYCVTVLQDIVWDPVHQCNMRMCTIWSLCETTLNLYRWFGSSESSFSACVESPIVNNSNEFVSLFHFQQVSVI